MSCDRQKISQQKIKEVELELFTGWEKKATEHCELIFSKRLRHK